MTKRSAKPKRKPGRPPLDVSRSVSLLIRLTPDESERYRAAAERRGQTLSEWLRGLADAGAAQ